MGLTLWTFDESMVVRDKNGDVTLIVPKEYDRIECAAIDPIRDCLVSVYAPSVIDVEPFTFENCVKLESVVLGQEIETIPESAFASCKNLKEIDFSGYCITIGDAAFANCEKLETFNFDNVVYVGDSGFLSSGLKGTIGHNSIEYFGAHAFQNTGVEHVVIDENATFVGVGAFSDNDHLESVLIDPASVLEIESEAFANCKKLKNVSYDKRNPNIYIAYDAFDDASVYEDNYNENEDEDERVL